MTVLSVSSDMVQTSKGPQAVSRKVPVSRIEIGDRRSPARIFDAEGRMLFMLPTSPPADLHTAPRLGAALPAELEAVRGAAAAFKANLATAVAAGPRPATSPAIRARANGSSICCPPRRDGGPGAPRSRGTWDRRRAWCGGSSDSSTTAMATPPRSSAIRHGPSPSRSTSRATAPSSRTASCRTTRTLARVSSGDASAASSSCRPKAGIARSSTSSSPTSGSDRGGAR